ncbi:UDP-N-acetylmuramate dehydrogenase [Geomonas paludis]|uniref:UDP-N-acetylenolpyruvoylglucosamine reductase n=1 Tax=Geomonas paludis TaxID=2740185 RepID=A0A6V8MU11_9BACT|nr:UDP-N-acetylmuramate dehydrogenase [Geomonas paludis]UPU35556.1 UDP-N-acetylmuramate dehydrogenase [Geomonas paludis]GFO62869.1 UDP-N-acetylenolpyruvoylglucosamine reductase [Geomonas paludis]
MTWSRAHLEQVAQGTQGTVLWDEPMSRHTSLRVGGPADLYLEPADIDDLQRVLEQLRSAGIPCLVIGGGYNLLVRDGGIRGCVVSLKGLDTLEPLPGARLDVGAGVTNQALTRFAAQQCLGGIEFLSAIPGSFGGALAMNAGAHGGETMQRVELLTTLRESGVLVRKRDELQYGYRFLKLEPGEIILGARLRLEPVERRLIEESIQEYIAKRGGQRVGFPNAGSFFKNPAGGSAWRLIDEAGLRGWMIGGAQVSEVHTNFLVNKGGALAADFLALAELIKSRVKETAGIELEEEVRIVGEG